MSVEVGAIGSAKAGMLERLEANRSIASNSSISASSTNTSLEFGTVMRGVVDGVNHQQVSAEKMVTDYELGLHDDLIGATVASQKASLSFSALMQVRNKLVENFDELLKMPL
ncbi:flagellar hook-basal body complex protein FliE [Vibrio mediterranei]|uniref:flagellar hook-basal body complex protein FliE n=1 Tax=Vibrio mediterranei TaxID=689 RepID=UPI004067923C